MTEEKKIKGRKRHIVVDIQGNLLAAVVHAANIHDSKAGIMAAESAYATYPTLRRFCGDAAYRGFFESQVKKRLLLDVDIVERKNRDNWEVLPKRWVVERTFSWLNSSRGLSKDYEITKSSAEAMIKIAHFRTLLKRL